MSIDTTNNDVFTLQERVASRWDGASSVGASIGARHAERAIADRLLDNLPGLAAFNGSFGADAWDVAGALAMAPMSMLAGGPAVRAMSMAELAEIVQIVLEEEELDVTFDGSDTRGDRSKQRQPAAQRAAATTAQRQKIAAVKRAIAEARKAAQVRRATQASQSRGNQAQAANIAKAAEAARRLESLQQAAAASPSESLALQIQAASVEFAGLQAAIEPTHDASGDFLSAGLAPVGTADPASAGVRAMARLVRHDPAQFGLLHQAPSLAAERGNELQPYAIAGAQQWQSAGSRALRLADVNADMAMVQPTTELGWSDATDGFGGAVVPRPSATATLPPAVLAASRVDPVTLQLRPGAPDAGYEQSGPSGFAAAGVPRPQRLLTPASATATPALAAAAITAALRVEQQHRTERSLVATAATRASAGERSRAAGGVDRPTSSLSPASAQKIAPLAQRSAAGLTHDAFAAAFAAKAPMPMGVGASWLAASDQATARLSQPLVAAAGVSPVVGYATAALASGESLVLGQSWTDGPAVDGGADFGRDVRRVPRQHAPSQVPTWLAPAAGASPIAAAGQRGVSLPQQIAAAAAAGARVPASAPGHAVPGVLGLGALDVASRWTQRALSAVAPATFAPRSAASAAVPSAVHGPTAAAFAVTSASEASAVAAAGSIGSFARGDVARFADTPAAYSGALLRDAGSGEWLLPGDEGYERATEQGRAGGGIARPPIAQGPSQRIDARQTAAAVQAQGALPSLKAAQTFLPAGAQKAALPGQAPLAQPAALAHGVGVQPALATAAAASPAFARAATAAVERFVNVHQRAIALDPVRAPAADGALALASVHASDRALGVTPLGARDALTPWLAQAALGAAGPTAMSIAPQAFSFAGDAALEHLAIGEEFATQPSAQTARAAALARAIRRAPVAGQAPSTVATTPAGASGATLVPGATAAPAVGTAQLGFAATGTSDAGEVLGRAVVSGGALPKVALPKLGGASLDLSSPVGLAAALRLFGESPSAIDSDAGTAFVERFFGRTGEIARSMLARAPATMETLRIAEGDVGATPVATSTSVARPGAAPSTAVAAPDGQALVVEGLAGLNALRALTRGQTGEQELRAMGAVEQTLLKPAAASASVTASESAATGGAATRPGKAAAAAAARPATSVRTHRFVPTALRRGRQLLGRSRRQTSLLNVSPTSVGGRHRFGYGSAELGGGALLGLTGDGGSFFGGEFGDNRTVGGAEQLSSSVRARRGTQPGQVGRSLTPRQVAQQQRLATPHGLPTHFDVRGDATYVDTSASPASDSMRYNPRKPASSATRQAVQAAAGATSASGGTSAAKASAASSVARVLSVTASPTANVLPLVAPAARAVAAAAAAKPLAESISTSGANPSMIAPMAGHDIAGQTAGGPGQGSTEKERAESGGTPAQELDQLAMKIARSVMIRIKRERERRGLHG